MLHQKISHFYFSASNLRIKILISNNYTYTTFLNLSILLLPSVTADPLIRKKALAEKELLRSIFPDSLIAKSYGSGRTKTTCMLNNAIAPHLTGMRSVM